MTFSPYTKMRILILVMLTLFLIPQKYHIHTEKSTGLSKRNGAKLRELSQNFTKLADWAVHGRSLFLAAVGAEIFKHGTILLHNPVHGGRRIFRMR